MSIRKYCVIGNPIGRSLSPNIYNYLYSIYDINSHYTRLNIYDVHHINELFSLLQLSGCNVTMPYKQTAFSIADKFDDASISTESANTLIINEEITAYNTDHFGFCKTIEHNKIDLNGKNILIIGAGNTAGTVVNAIGEANCSIDIINRSSQNLDILQEFYPYIHKKDISNINNNYDLVINTSPDSDYLTDASKYIITNIVMDYNYTTSPLKSLFASDVKYISGIEMLIHQALQAFNHYITSIGLEPINVDDKSLFNKIFTEINGCIPKKKNISLIGFMGTGKSTIGKILAEKLNMNFISTDIMIEEKIGMSINEIFQQYGESRFREIESEVLKTIENVENSIISTGGGICINDRNIELLKDISYCVHLVSNIQEISERVQDNERPLINTISKDNISNLYYNRLDNYFKCSDLIVYNTGNISKVAEVIENEIKPILCL